MNGMQCHGERGAFRFGEQAVYRGRFVWMKIKKYKLEVKRGGRIQLTVVLNVLISRLAIVMAAVGEKDLFFINYNLPSASVLSNVCAHEQFIWAWYEILLMQISFRKPHSTEYLLNLDVNVVCGNSSVRQQHQTRATANKTEEKRKSTVEPWEPCERGVYERLIDNVF